MLGLREHHPRSGKASGAITGQRFVVLTTTEGVLKQADAAGALVEGVAKFDAEDGKIFTFHSDGDLQVEASEAVAVGDEISTTNVGKAQVAAATEHIVAHALTAAAADGDMIVVRMLRGKSVKA